MATDKITIAGTIDDKPLSAATKAKVQDALKSAIEAEAKAAPADVHGSVHGSVIIHQK
jgi:hypothetical protein